MLRWHALSVRFCLGFSADCSSIYRARPKSQEAQIKRAAAKGDKVEAQALAKQLVRVRQQRTKSYAASSKVADIGGHMTTAQANMKLTTAMAGATKACCLLCCALRMRFSLVY